MTIVQPAQGVSKLHRGVATDTSTYISELHDLPVTNLLDDPSRRPRRACVTDRRQQRRVRMRSVDQS